MESLQQLYEVDTISIPILRMRKQRYTEAESLAADKWQGQEARRTSLLEMT